MGDLSLCMLRAKVHRSPRALIMEVLGSARSLHDLPCHSYPGHAPRVLTGYLNSVAAQHAAVLRNFEFFGAPVAAVLCMSSDLEKWDAMSVGLYLQTLTLALTERGLGTCAEVSVAGYPDILRKELGIGEDLDVLCGYGTFLNPGVKEIQVC